METSRQVSRITVSEEQYKKLESDVQKLQKEERTKKLRELLEKYKMVEERMDNMNSNGNERKWISVEKGGFRICMDLRILIVNEEDMEPRRITIPISKEEEKCVKTSKKVQVKDKNYLFVIPDETELRAVLFDAEKGMKKAYTCGIYQDGHFMAKCLGKVQGTSGKEIRKEGLKKPYGTFASARLIRVYHLKEETLSAICTQMELIPDDLPEGDKKIMRSVFEKIKTGELICEKGNQIKICKKNDADVTADGKYSNELLKQAFVRSLLQCDRKRAAMRTYEHKILEDPMKGHWDLWSGAKGKTEKNSHVFDFSKQKLMAKNPLSSVRKNGIIGIDFGTKSTVVACQDGSEHIVFKRIGASDVSKKESTQDYENPTVMQFRDVKAFVDAYRKKQGRPFTEWNDMIVSHSASGELINAELINPEVFYSFFYDLKQWAREPERAVVVRDMKGQDYDMRSYLTTKSVDEGGIDPIEIYAYYLGLYINNMDDGIYLNYLLSFPVNYEKKVRERIRKSFENGLKKSIPEEIFQDPEMAKLFHVQEGAGEPEAYAICAVKEFGIEPEEDNPVFYGVFDFGGGTTDYDFGIVRDPEEAESDRYDYEVVHLGDGGDSYLGGENLLRKLAYKVFMENMDLCQKEDFVFQKPHGVEPGTRYQYYMDDSKEAYMNMKMLMEQLRPFWESSGEISSDSRKENSTKNQNAQTQQEITVSLFNRQGDMKPNCKLKADRNNIQKWIQEEIEHGVRNFFEQLKSISGRKELENAQGMKIFLAGNSCKSPYVMEAFNKEIKNIPDGVKEGIEIYPPLGSEQADKMQKKQHMERASDISVCPTGKTGVAYGLILGRPTGKFKIVQSEDCSEEAAFRYYLGINKKDKFMTRLSRDDHKYGEWNKFRNAVQGETEFEVLFTPLAEVTTQKTPVTNKGIYKKVVTLKCETKENENIYMKFVEPDTVECGVGENEGTIRKESIFKVRFFEED